LPNFQNRLLWFIDTEFDINNICVHFCSKQVHVIIWDEWKKNQSTRNYFKPYSVQQNKGKKEIKYSDDGEGQVNPAGNIITQEGALVTTHEGRQGAVGGVDTGGTSITPF
jgi:hypothetical protein